MPLVAADALVGRLARRTDTLIAAGFRFAERTPKPRGIRPATELFPLLSLLLMR